MPPSSSTHQLPLVASHSSQQPTRLGATSTARRAPQPPATTHPPQCAMALKSFAGPQPIACHSPLNSIVEMLTGSRRQRACRGRKAERIPVRRQLIAAREQQPQHALGFSLVGLAMVTIGTRAAVPTATEMNPRSCQPAPPRSSR